MRGLEGSQGTTFAGPRVVSAVGAAREEEQRIKRRPRANPTNSAMSKTYMHQIDLTYHWAAACVLLADPRLSVTERGSGYDTDRVVR